MSAVEWTKAVAGWAPVHFKLVGIEVLSETDAAVSFMYPGINYAIVVLITKVDTTWVCEVAKKVAGGAVKTLVATKVPESLLVVPSEMVGVPPTFRTDFAGSVVFALFVEAEAMLPKANKVELPPIVQETYTPVSGHIPRDASLTFDKAYVGKLKAIADNPEAYKAASVKGKEAFAFVNAKMKVEQEAPEARETEREPKEPEEG